jgi:hypothetical protein
MKSRESVVLPGMSTVWYLEGSVVLLAMVHEDAGLLVTVGLELQVQ